MGVTESVKTHLRSHFPVFTFVWGCHTESPANSPAERQPTRPATGGCVRFHWPPVLGLVPVGQQKKEPLQCGRPERELPRQYTSVDRYTTTSNTTQCSGVKGWGVRHRQPCPKMRSDREPGNHTRLASPSAHKVNLVHHAKKKKRLPLQR